MSQIPLNQIVLGDCLETLKAMPSSSIDLILCDPPYGYSFMGKNWDQAVPSVEVWRECLRVLKPGAFAFVMSAPRQDVLSQMIVRLTTAGFDTSFTSLYWTYASGFPKALNISKAIDRRLGALRTVTGKDKKFGRTNSGIYQFNDGSKMARYEFERTDQPASALAKKLHGSYGSFQPKPAVELILVCMKPLSKKTYVDQVIANGHGVTWLDDCRIPYQGGEPKWDAHFDKSEGGQSCYKINGQKNGANDQGRFPANLLVTDSVLDQFSRYFDLDAWSKTFPFLICPKASQSERNRGLDDLVQVNANIFFSEKRNKQRLGFRQNTHPTVKPLRLMAYLIMLGSRPGEIIFDPYCGSGSTCVAAVNIGRQFIGCELSAEYKKIADARLALTKKLNASLLPKGKD